MSARRYAPPRRAQLPADVRATLARLERERTDDNVSIEAWRSDVWTLATRVADLPRRQREVFAAAVRGLMAHELGVRSCIAWLEGRPS